jgi:nitroreductase
VKTSAIQFYGHANKLSPGHHPWPIIDEVTAATNHVTGLLSPTSLTRPTTPPWPPPTPPPCADPASRIIRQRRSATSFDGVTPISRATFLQLLDLTLPRPDVIPFDAWPFAPRVHLVICVHRVTGVDPGLYVWVRDLLHLDPLRAAFNPEFHWQCDQPKTCPLFELGKTDLREFAQTQACHQGIASDGAFSLGMLAHFDPTLRTVGPHAYRELFWETGMIGQSLYLGAEAAGARATGIGCFFDDVLHRALGLKDRTWQSLYHFTLGTAVDDPRLKTAPPYPVGRGRKS